MPSPVPRCTSARALSGPLMCLSSVLFKIFSLICLQLVLDLLNVCTWLSALCWHAHERAGEGAEQVMDISILIDSWAIVSLLLRFLLVSLFAHAVNWRMFPECFPGIIWGPMPLETGFCKGNAAPLPTIAMNQFPKAVSKGQGSFRRGPSLAPCATPLLHGCPLQSPLVTACCWLSQTLPSLLLLPLSGSAKTLDSTCLCLWLSLHSISVFFVQVAC